MEDDGEIQITPTGHQGNRHRCFSRLIEFINQILPYKIGQELLIKTFSRCNPLLYLILVRSDLKPVLARYFVAIVGFQDSLKDNLEQKRQILWKTSLLCSSDIVRYQLRSAERPNGSEQLAIQMGNRFLNSLRII